MRKKNILSAMESQLDNADNSSLSGRVMAVLVLYKCLPENSASWKILKDMLGKGETLNLVKCLVFDNSPKGFLPATHFLPDGFMLHRHPENVGTAGAYVKAISTANDLDCDWLLLLDQDTVLPPNYLKLVAENVHTTNLPHDVIVPRVWHGSRLISPALLTDIGSVRPTTNLIQKKGIPTAISSGAIIRTKALQAILPFPHGLWLDYVDHWMFLSFARQAFSVVGTKVDLQHDLSIENVQQLELARLDSILRAETVVCRALGFKARSILPLRRAVRAMRFIVKGEKRLAIMTMRHSLGGWANQ